MTESKSTDKLEVMRDIVKETINELSVDERERLKEINITWTSVSSLFGGDEMMVVPELNIAFYEKG